MSLLEELSNPHSVTEILENYYDEFMTYSSIHNNPDYNITPNEMIALQTKELLAYKRYGFLRGLNTGRVYSKVESITLDRQLGINLNNTVPLGIILKQFNHSRENIYAKSVSEQDEAGNDIIFRITARLWVNEQPVALVKEWIYG